MKSCIIPTGMKNKAMDCSMGPVQWIEKQESLHPGGNKPAAWDRLFALIINPIHGGKTRIP
jgi:hypothetical protein